MIISKKRIYKCRHLTKTAVAVQYCVLVLGLFWNLDRLTDLSIGSSHFTRQNTFDGTLSSAQSW